MNLSDKTIIWSNSEKDLKDWDYFLRHEPRGNCQQASHWLSSFQNYGFNSEILIVRDEDNKLIAGIGTVFSKIPFLNVFLAPSGPILSEGYEDLFESILNLFLDRAKERKAFYCHINVPVIKVRNSNMKKYCLEKISLDSILFSGNLGSEFQHVTSINGMRPVYIDYNQGISAYEFVKKGFKRNTKANIRIAYRNDLELKYASSEKEIERAYDLIVQNALQIGYDIRSWVDSKVMLLGMINSNTCIVPCCYDKGVLKGVLIVFDIGKRLTPMYGGIIREERDLKIGHFLHNEMLKLSIEKSYSIYDISVIGNEGVTRFKKGFGSEYIEFVGSRFWILDEFRFKIYKRVNTIAEKHKKNVRWFLNFIS